MERLHGFKRLSLAPMAAEEVRTDVVALTHEHTGHLDPDAVPVIAASNPRCLFAAPIGCAESLARAGIAPDRRVVLAPNRVHDLGGVAGLTKALANEWAARNINVNAIAPGYFDTEMCAAIVHDPVREPRIRERIPAGRWGRPEDLVGAVLFLAGDASRYAHGHVLVVDGGWMGR